MRILVIGGMHGNEPLGPAIVKRLQDSPEAYVDTMLANEQAIIADQRFVRSDLNRSFPGEPTSADYETRRAAEIIVACKQYDLVLDFHNTNCPENDCTFIGAGAKRLLYDVSAWLGLRRVIVADYDCLNKYASNCVSIEISLNSPRMNVDGWVESIRRLAREPAIEPAQGLQLYKFVYRMSLADRDRLALDMQQLQAFKPLPAKLAVALKVATPAYPIFIADAYTPYNYGGLLNEINV